MLRRATSRITAERTGTVTDNAPILDEDEVQRRKMLLAELQAALMALGIQGVLASHRQLVLRYNDPPPLAPSGPTSPTLHLFGPDGARVATTDGTAYQVDDGRTFPISDPAAAAADICRSQALPGQPAQAR